MSNCIKSVQSIIMGKKSHIFAAFLAIGATLLGAYLVQPSFLYFQRQYTTDDQEDAELLFRRNGFELFRISYDLKNQTGVKFSYLAIPRFVIENKQKVSMFMLFGGNGMTALDWTDWVVQMRYYLSSYPSVAFVLVDYPGYGSNDGEPSPDSMHESAQSSYKSALKSLKDKGIEVDEVNVVGHSIGCAVATRWVSSLVPSSDQHSVSRLVLSAPFTSITDMVSVVFPIVPKPLAKLVARHDWDNRKTVKGILDNRIADRIFVIHGGQDDIVPFDMGKELSEIGLSTFIPVKNAGHNDILNLVKLYGYVLSAPRGDSSVS